MLFEQRADLVGAELGEVVIPLADGAEQLRLKHRRPRRRPSWPTAAASRAVLPARRGPPGTPLIYLMLLIMLTGNFDFFSLQTIALALVVLDDGVVLRLLANFAPDWEPPGRRARRTCSGCCGTTRSRTNGRCDGRTKGSARMSW